MSVPPEAPDRIGIDVAVAVLSRWPVIGQRRHQLAFADDHLDQARALAVRLTDPALDGDLPVLLMADLNAGPGAPQIRPLTDVMVDAWVAGGGEGDGVTLSSANPFAPREALVQIDRRIDYVLVRPGRAERPVRVERAFLAAPADGGLPPSDHHAVVADLAL